MKPSESELRDLYIDQGLSTRTIAGRYGTSHMSVKRWIKACGIQARPKGRGLDNRGIAAPSRDELFRMIHVEYLGYEKVAARYGVDMSAVGHWMIKHGIPRLTAADTRAKGRRVLLNEAEVRDLCASNKTSREVADRLGVSPSTIQYFCRKHGIELLAGGLGFKRIRYQCTNGTLVRSSYERTVGDWLSAHGLPFVYEPRLDFDRRLRADFLVNGWYVEVWGITGSESYDAGRKLKVGLYRKHGYPLVQLTIHHFTPRRRNVLEKRLAKTLLPAQCLHEFRLVPS